jgi:TonB family protein
MALSLDLLESELELAELGESSIPPPSLVIELPSAAGVFFGNLRDLVWKAKQPPLHIASKPADFWPDVFVTRGAAWGRFLQSILLHGLAAGLLWAAILVLPRAPLKAEQPTLQKEDVIYYSPSEYLPPLDTGGAHAQAPAKGDPELSPQPIISVPPEADNHTQTIVAPPNVKLNHEVPMPNVVSWAQRALAVPIEATSRLVSSAKAALDVPVVAPAPEMETASSLRSLETPQAAVVAPPPSVDTSIRRTADLSIGRSEVIAPAPQLSIDAQRSRMAPALGGSQTAVAPSPSVQPAGLASSGQQLIALGIHPIAASGPMETPAGNRRGTFAATPQGKTGAAGTPEAAPSSAQTAASKGTGSSGSGAGTGASSEVPPGLHVGPVPSTNSSAVAGSNGGNGSGGGKASSVDNRFLLAKVVPPRVTSTPPRTSAPAVQESEEEKQVFGDRKFYAMTVNMPNLNSAGGSWVIHFAERNETDKGDLSAPQAIAIADPGYPLELMKQNIHGTVTLYAVIRSDGSVGNVRVLRSVDDQLDKYASDALARWHFRPATKNGAPVDLEAVVTIPFRPGKVRPSF